MNGGMGLVLLLSSLIFYDPCLVPVAGSGMCVVIGPGGNSIVIAQRILVYIRSIVAVSISTPAYLVVEEGMELRLDCTLNYSAHTQMQDIKLDWFHNPRSDVGEDPIFFHYQNLSVVAMNSSFTPRLQWVGDIRQNNGSILITDVKCNDTGNFICDMRIPRLSSNIYRSSTHLRVLCKVPSGIGRKRVLLPLDSEEAVPKNIIIYTTVGAFTLFVALLLVIMWRKYSMHTAPRSQSGNDPGVLESSEEIDQYFTMTRKPPLQRDRESKATEDQKNKESKTGEDPIYVTMRSFLGTGKSANRLPIPIVLSHPIPGEL